MKVTDEMVERAIAAVDDQWGFCPGEGATKEVLERVLKAVPEPPREFEVVEHAIRMQWLNDCEDERSNLEEEIDELEAKLRSMGEANHLHRTGLHNWMARCEAAEAKLARIEAVYRRSNDIGDMDELVDIFDPEG